MKQKIGQRFTNLIKNVMLILIPIFLPLLFFIRIFFIIFPNKYKKQFISTRQFIYHKTKYSMSHKDGVLRSYELEPAIKDYDNFMHIGARFLPYTMYFHYSNFESPTINTDILGFRYSYKGKEKFSPANLPPSNSINLFIGGSTALGVGATNDKFTIPSYLSTLRNEYWLNLGGRGYNATQEALLFMMHYPKFRDIKKVIVFSGINTLALEGMPEEFTSDHGKYYYSYEFQYYMNMYNEDLKKKQDTYSDNLLYKKEVSNSIKDFNPTEKIINDAESLLSRRIITAGENIIQSLYNLKLLLVPFNVSPIFILQPMAYWIKDTLSPQEKDLFLAADASPNNFYRLFSKVLQKEVHKPFYYYLKNKCEKLDIECFDMNEFLKESDFINEFIFVDRVHFNNFGHMEIARIINTKIL